MTAYVQGPRPSGPVDPLPLIAGAVAVDPSRLAEVDGWTDTLEVDGELERYGITWLRVRGGFGSGQRTGWHPREDWIADIPGVSISIHRSFDRPDHWGSPFEKARDVPLDEAMEKAIIAGLAHAQWLRTEAEQKLLNYRGGELALQDAAAALEDES